MYSYSGKTDLTEISLVFILLLVLILFFFLLAWYHILGKSGFFLIANWQSECHQLLQLGEMLCNHPLIGLCQFLRSDVINSTSFSMKQIELLVAATWSSVFSCTVILTLSAFRSSSKNLFAVSLSFVTIALYSGKYQLGSFSTAVSQSFS